MNGLLSGGAPYREALAKLLQGDTGGLNTAGQDLQGLLKMPPEMQKRYLDIMAGQAAPVDPRGVSLPPVGAMYMVRPR